MHYLKSIAVLCLIAFISCTIKNNASEELTKIIENINSHKGYDAKEYPLGLYTKQYYKGEADFTVN